MKINSLKSDIKSSIAVFLVALPLCLGIALASGAPLISGLVSGLVGGLVVGIISSSHVSVSGPAAGLTVVCLESINKLGSYNIFLNSVIIAGLIQAILYLFRLGFIVDYVPTSVIQGMMAAIGIVIIIKQVPHALGRDIDFEGDFRFFATSTHDNSFYEILNALNSIHPGSITITLVSLLIIYSWDNMKIFNKLKMAIPSSLVAVFFAILLNQYFNLNLPTFYLKEDQGHRVSVPTDLSTFSGIFSALPLPNLNHFLQKEVWQIAFIIAIIASIESLLSLEASEKIDKKRRLTDPNRELLAQGIGNTLSGFIGGLPITSVVVRTTVNVNAGAESKLSCIFHSIFIFLSVIFLPNILNQIPLAALSAILMIVGLKLCSLKIIKKIWKLGNVQFYPFLVTIVAVVFSDILTGTLIGCIFGLFFVIKSMHLRAFTIVSDHNQYLIKFNKDVFFLNKAELKEKLGTIPNNSIVTLDGTKAAVIDHDIKDLIKDFIKSSEYKNIKVEVKHIRNVIG